MELIEVRPTTVSLRFPDSLSVEVTVQNLTLHQLAVRVLCTNPSNFIISPSVFRMESFEEVKLRVQVKYYQQALLSNYLGNKVHLYCYDEDQEGELWNAVGMSSDRLRKIARTELQLNCTAEMEHHVIVQPKKKQLLLNVHRYVGPLVLSSNDKHTLITFLETLGDVKCLHALQDGNFIAEYRQLIHNNVSLLQQVPMADQKLALYAISTVPIICKERHVPPEVPPISYEQKKWHTQAFEVVLQQRQFEPEPIPKKQEQPVEVAPRPDPIKIRRPTDLVSTFIGAQSPVKATFANNGNKKKRRNKSQEAVRNVYSSGEEDEEDDQNKLFVDSRLVALSPPPKRSSPPQSIKEQKTQQPAQHQQPQPEVKKEPQLLKHETVNCITHPISLLVSHNKYFILFANVIVAYDIDGKLNQGKVIPLEESSTFNEHKFKKVFMKHHSCYVVFGCDYSFNVVNLEQGHAEWVTVQRKEILDVAILKQKGLVAVGGKNFSKFSLFGKTTQRSNIKLYQLEGKHDHLYTYDIDNAGVIIQLEEIEIDDKHLMVALGELDSVQTMYLLNVVSPTKIEIIGKFDLGDDLALQPIRWLHNSNNALFGLECMHIDNRDIMVVKRFHLKLSGWKSSIATETCSIKHGTYSFFECDDRYLLVYSVSNEQLILYDNNTRNSTTYRVPAGFRLVRLGHPYLFLQYDNYIDIKKFSLLS